MLAALHTTDIVPSKMRILMISAFDLCLSRLWGPTVRLHELAKALIRGGHDVVLAGPPPRGGERATALDGVPLYYLPINHHRYPYQLDKPTKINRRYRQLGAVLLRTADLVKRSLLREFDVVYLSRAFIDTAYPALAAHWAGVPLVCDWDDLEGVHGFVTASRSPISTQLITTANELLMPRLSDATVVASRYLFELAKQVNVPSTRLFYAPTVADAERFHPRNDGTAIRARYGLQDAKVLLYVGNLEHNNGVNVETIIHVLDRLRRITAKGTNDANVHLLVVGGGQMLEKHGEPGVLPRLVASLGLERHVTFTGTVPSNEVPSYVAAADLCLALFPVTPITMSKSPLKVYEYLAAGKPVIARAVGEMANCVVDGKTGVLVHSDDVEEYVAAIARCLADERCLKQMGNDARVLIEQKFLWRYSAATVEQACQCAIDTAS